MYKLVVASNRVSSFNSFNLKYLLKSIFLDILTMAILIKTKRHKGIVVFNKYKYNLVSKNLRINENIKLIGVLVQSNSKVVNKKDILNTDQLHNYNSHKQKTAENIYVVKKKLF
jgi:hypothetical protein